MNTHLLPASGFCTRLLSSGGFLALLVWSSGCTSIPPVDYARPYPKELPAGQTVDVQVFRRSTTLDFTNTTASPLGPGTIWLNRRFSRPIKDPIGVGQTVALPLGEFRDEFGDPFRAGGFWASDTPDALVLCQVEQAPGAGVESEKPVIVGLVTVQSFADD
ncbi:MAG: hypothetical protein KF805_11435 [Phycisphaeraceae bacterium]|nr:hypothetical protein [Phycisphaeraceae bacterium]